MWHDARRLDQLAAPPFDTVLDCLLFHALVGADRAAYLTGHTKTLRVGGCLILLCYADSQPDVPHRVSRAELLDSFQKGWRIDSHRPTTVETNVHPDGGRGWLAVLTRSDRPW